MSNSSQSWDLQMCPHEEKGSLWMGLRTLTWEDYPGLSGWAPNPSQVSLEREAEGAPAHRGGRDWGVQPHARDTWSPQKVGGAGGILPRELMEGAQPCPHPDFGLLAPRTRKDYVFVVLSHSVCGRLSQQPQRDNTESEKEQGHPSIFVASPQVTLIGHCVP